MLPCLKSTEVRVSEISEKSQSAKILSYVLVVLSNSKFQWYYSHCSGLHQTTEYPDKQLLISTACGSCALLCRILLRNLYISALHFMA